MCHNLFLEAVALGLASCIFACIQVEPVTKTLGLKETQVLRIAQAVGAVKSPTPLGQKKYPKVTRYISSASFLPGLGLLSQSQLY